MIQKRKVSIYILVWVLFRESFFFMSELKENCIIKSLAHYAFDFSDEYIQPSNKACAFLFLAPSKAVLCG